MNKYKILFYSGMVMSLLIGLWHFFVPALYGWYSYIPAEYEVLSVTIDYVNICFSVLLFGLSALLIWWGGRIFEGNAEATTLYEFCVGGANWGCHCKADPRRCQCVACIWTARCLGTDCNFADCSPNKIT